MEDEMERCLLGDKLYGDDFSIEELCEWFSDEAKGSAHVGSNAQAPSSYSYHQLDYYHGFRFLEGRHFQSALGIGNACRDGLAPIAKSLSNITILTPSETGTEAKDIWGIPCVYQKLNPSGDIDIESNSLDLIASLGALPHIPNVSHVLNECSRCLTKGGIMLLREPIISMGDWRKPRPGLTKRERGIPAHLLERILKHAGLKTIRRSLCAFPVIPKLASTFGVSAYNNPALTVADSLVSRLFAWNTKYHRVSMFEKLGPVSIFYILTK